jgi:sarcosine oxidase
MDPGFRRDDPWKERAISDSPASSQTVRKGRFHRIPPPCSTKRVANLAEAGLSERFDVAVVGIGATGSAVLHELARRGGRVIGIEQFDPGHDRGSSHGESRILRLSYFEHPSYVPMLVAAREKWMALDQDTEGEKLFVETGCLEVGPPNAELVQRSLQASRRHHLDVEELTGGEIEQRFPAFRLPKDWFGIFQPQGGFVRPEMAIRRHVDLATRAGARLLTRTRVERLESRPDGVRLILPGGELVAEAVVVTAGAWLQQLVSQSRMPLAISRQVVGWFEPDDASLFAVGRFPVFLLATGQDAYYGFPDLGSGFKMASHVLGPSLASADALRQDAAAADENRIRMALGRYLPEADGRCLRMQTCMYTNTPDGHFLLDRAEHDARIVIGSACSGHGFKFAPVLGEILADMAQNKPPRFPIDGFSLNPGLRLAAVPRLAS